MFLIKNKNKLKFDFKKNATMDKLSFNISPTKANKKIKLKKKEMKNIMVVSREKTARAGKKRKIVEILDTLLVKALQSYDKYTVLNPLEINIR